MRRILFIGLVLSCLISSIPVVTMVEAVDSNIIVFDYSHGQRSENALDEDQALQTTLEGLGYEIVWALGGLNTSILEDAKALVIGSIYPSTNGFSLAEIAAIISWFNTGSKFMWIGCDSDYDGPFINGNMSLILGSVGSHVYPESAFIDDPISNAGASYRAIATGTSINPFVSSTGYGVEAISMHGGTCLYGSNSTIPGEGVEPVALEDTYISDVYPILYYNESAILDDRDLIPPLAHDDEDEGAFVAATMEFGLCADDSGVIVVSGASPYGDYAPMCSDEYQSVTLQGQAFVSQTIELGIEYAREQIPPVVTLQSSSFTANTDLFVNATVIDASNITSVILLYAYNETLTLPSNVTMTEISPGLWTASIPWPGFDTPITYMVYAKDSAGNYGTSQIITVLGIESITETTSTTTTQTPPPVDILLPILIIVGVGAVIVVVVMIIYSRSRTRGG